MIFIPDKFKIEKERKVLEDVKFIKVKSNKNFLPGQFFQISILGIGECPLSPCSFERKHLEFIIRKVGGVTSALYNLKKGDKIFLRGPYGGSYPIDSFLKRDILLLAGGTGIAPIMCLADYILKNRERFGRVCVFFGFRDEEHILLYEKINKLKEHFEVYICLDSTNKKGYENGRIDNVLEKKNFEIKNMLAVLCGPEPMMESITEKLNKKGLTNDKIYWNMERRMECAIGSCGRCLIQDLYVCKDGPVFRYDKIKERIENEKK